MTKIKIEKPDDVIENPWEVESIYEFYFFNCPTCSYKHASKQDFVQHVFDFHPESIDFLKNISDGSLTDIATPWQNEQVDFEGNFVKNHLKVEFNDQGDEYDNDYYNYDGYDEKMTSKLIGGDSNGKAMNDASKKKSRIHKCDSCEKEFATTYNLRRHIDSVHGGQKDHKCDFCTKAFTRMDVLTRHMKTVHEGVDFEETNEYDDPSEIVDGIKDESNGSIEGINKDHKCDKCGKLFSAAGTLNRHIHTIHEGHKDHKCETCGKAFSQADNLRRHIRINHEGVKDHKCESCGKNFSGAYHLKRHMNTVHSGIKKQRNGSQVKPDPSAPRTKDHTCDHCGKSFFKAEYLRIHIYTIHEGHRDFKCDQCGKTFTQAPTLKKHIAVVHEGQKNHICDTCGAAFAQKYDLKKHIHTVHDKAKDYKCDQCGKDFARLDKIREHIHTVHEGRRDYKCHTCGKDFSRHNHLKRHYDAVHEGLKEHKCEFCGKAFSQKGDMQKHRNKVHEREALQNEFLRGRPPPSDERLPTLQKALPLVPQNFPRPAGNLKTTLNTTSQ